VAFALTDPSAATFAVVFVRGNEDLPRRLPRIGAHIRAGLARPPEMAPAFATGATVLPDQWSPASPASQHPGCQGTCPGTPILVGAGAVVGIDLSLAGTYSVFARLARRYALSHLTSRFCRHARRSCPEPRPLVCSLAPCRSRENDSKLSTAFGA
jgi:hypothetical protein